MKTRQEYILWAALFAVLLLQIALWSYTKSIQARWLNVPPVPSEFALTANFLGDKQLAYRASSVMLQNMGDEGGRVSAFPLYNYDNLQGWLFLLSHLDPVSDYIPYIAAYYFGSVDGHPEKTRRIVEFLHVAGNSPEGQKWRWLAQAVFLARFKMHDMDYALTIAKDLAKLADHTETHMPNWTRQMPAFILSDMGEKDAAYAIMIEILKSVGDKIDPAEVRHTVGYICETILSPQEAGLNPLCKELH